MAEQVTIQVTENKTINVSDVLGNLKIADTAPTAQGLYILSDTGTYTNLGGLVATADKLNYAYFDGTTWSKVDVAMPSNKISTWTSKAYTSGSQVIYNGKIYEANTAVSDDDVPDRSLKWILKSGGNLKESSGNLFNKNAIMNSGYIDENGNPQPNAAYSFTNLIPVKPNQDYYVKALRNVTEYGDNGFIKDNLYSNLPGVLTTDANTKFVSITFQNGSEGVIMSEGSVAVSSADYQEPDAKSILTPVWKVIVHDDKSYNSIRNLAEECFQKANFYNRYEIKLVEGTYTETDWKGFGDFVKITSYRNNAVIYFDGDSTNILPSDYSYPVAAGQASNTQPAGFKHIVFAQRNLICENLIFHAENCKYPIHIDNPNFTNLHFKNCRIKEKKCNYPVGIGIWANQTVTFENCTFEREHWHLKRTGIFYHNSFNQSNGSETNFINCSFVQCGYATIYENGSNREDKFNLINCFSDSVGEIEYGVSQDADGKTFWTNHITGVKIADPRNIPYNIKLNTAGTNIDYIEDSPNFVGYNSSRPEFYKHIISDYIGVAMVPVNSPDILKGDLICSHGDADNNSAPRVKKFTSFTSDLPYIGVSLEDAVVGKEIYFAKRGKYAPIKVTGTTGNEVNRKLKFDQTSGTFVVDAALNIKDIDALAYKSKADAAVGLLVAKVL